MLSSQQMHFPVFVHDFLYFALNHEDEYENGCGYEDMDEEKIEDEWEQGFVVFWSLIVPVIRQSVLSNDGIFGMIDSWITRFSKVLYPHILGVCTNESIFWKTNNHARRESPDLVDNDSVLALLYEVYNEINSMDYDRIRADFHALYKAMNGKEMDKIIYPVCRLCRDH